MYRCGEMVAHRYLLTQHQVNLRVLEEECQEQTNNSQNHIQKKHVYMIVQIYNSKT